MCSKVTILKLPVEETNQCPVPGSYLRTPLAHRTRALSGNHLVSQTHDAAVERVPTTFHVVKLGFRCAIIHADGGEEHLAFGGHVLESENARRRFQNVCSAYSGFAMVSTDPTKFRPWRTTPPAPCLCSSKGPHRRHHRQSCPQPLPPGSVSIRSMHQRHSEEFLREQWQCQPSL